MKKLSMLLSTVMLVSGLTMGCSSKETAGTKTEGKDSETTISFIHWRGEDAKVFEEIIKDFETANPKIKVKMTVYPSEQYQSTAQTLLRDGQTGDVFTSFPGSQFEAINKAGLFTDLSKEAFVNNFNKNLITNGQKDGKQLAMPYQLVFNQPVYNTEIFKKLNLEVPKDWDSFLKVCETLKKNGYTPIAFPGADIGPGQFMNTMVMNNEPDEKATANLVTGQTKATDDWWVKTLKQFKELNDKGYFQKDALGTKHEGAIALMAQEKAAMIATGSYSMASIQKQNPNVKLQLLAPITVSADQAKFEGVHTSTFMLAVNSKSKKQAEAKKFIEFLSTKDTAGKYANKTGQHLTIKDVNYESQTLKDTAVWMNKKTTFQPRFLITNADIEKAVIGSIQDVLGGTGPDAAAKKAQQIIDQHVKK